MRLGKAESAVSSVRQVSACPWAPFKVMSGSLAALLTAPLLQIWEGTLSLLISQWSQMCKVLFPPVSSQALLFSVACPLNRICSTPDSHLTLQLQELSASPLTALKTDSGKNTTRSSPDGMATLSATGKLTGSASYWTNAHTLFSQFQIGAQGNRIRTGAITG